MKNPELEKRIAEESAKIKVDSYQKAASIGGWMGSGRGLWAISIVGAVSGAVIGLVAPVIPALLVAGVAMPNLALIGTSIAAFAATGLSTGFAGGLMLGRISGATAAVAEESERRAKEWTTRQLISQNPDIKIVPDAPKKPEAKKSLGKQLRDSYYTYFNPRVGLAMAAIGLVGGLVLGAAFIATGGAAGAIMPALGTLTGVAMPTAAALAEMGSAAFSATQAAVVMSYTAGVTATIGALWTVNYPKITSAMTYFFGELMSGRLLGREWKPPSEVPAQAKEKAPEIIMATPEKSSARSFSDFRALVARQETERANDLLTRN